MKFLRQLFSTQRAFVGEFIEHGDALLSLVASNEVVAREFSVYEKQIAAAKTDAEKEQVAIRSADALSGYGISVAPQAFLEAME